MVDKYDGLNLSDYDKKIIKKRIEMENRKWVFDNVVKAILGIAIGLFIAKALNG